MKNLTIFLALVCSVLHSPSRATDLELSTRKAIDSAIVAEMVKQEAVGLAIGIIQDGEVVYTQGYGYSDLAKNRKVNGKVKSSYYSFPGILDRRKFLKQYKFGFPFRLHPSIKS